jgi:hypothetical protein
MLNTSNTFSCGISKAGKELWGSILMPEGIHHKI